ncbi:peptide chain release factor N(5)-glutamine methyltransferase [Aurantiacibacter rhizosphaerae]|uniref:Release factor glutamine methyltransferase n=1 Tax=Aurantiacibacter rhizosphaerae TaxID=2691582 RepID=A0A844XGW6_9SPHN|nr:peptide chain release factor N(5)-glutamine methyltransferase [Aurantiacibacter rhizosphaerae]MWV28808.1 peptide chain release factor N(5)-glutamine methyltransferase [Aurantiacibacter rhizosphaerae]
MADTVASAIREAATRLSGTSDTARLDAELLMAHALGCSRSDMLLRRMQDAAPAGFASLVDRRAACEPVAYIIGAQEFYGRSFAVTPDVLIPRGDSESVVEAALNAVLNAAPEAPRILDCGTGSGALLLTLLAELPDAQGVGIDASAPAVEVARGNAARLGMTGRADIRVADWTVPGWADDLGQFDLIIANPPYVESDAQLDADVRDYEPASALFAGPDGLDDYAILIPQLPKLLMKNGIAVLEIGSTQAEMVSEIAQQHGFAATAHKDLGQRDRALLLRLRLGKAESSG